MSASNFLLSVILMTRLSPEEFGIFAFTQILVFLGFGISNAVLSAPLMAELHRSHQPQKETQASFFRANMGLGLAAAFTIGLLLLFGFEQGTKTALFFFAATLLLFIGRLGRSYLLDHEKAGQILLSDGIYSVTLAFGGLSLMVGDPPTLADIGLLLTLAALLSYGAMGRELLALQIQGLRSGTGASFWKAFQEHGRHALTGVLTTEATSRAHAYVVTLWLGAQAFAPLAVAALFFRPVFLVILSLTQFERAKLARTLREGKKKEAWQALRFFYAALGLTWAANLLLAMGVLVFFFTPLLGNKYDPETIALATGIYAVLAALAALRGPTSALLQANADFRPLAKATIVSSLVALPLVFGAVIGGGAVESLFGVLAGEALGTGLIITTARRRILKT